jgi:putative protease
MYVYNDKTGKCNICKNNKNYYLRDRFHNDYLIKSKNCLMHIFNYSKLNLIDQINEMYDFGIRNYRLNFVDEDYDECLTILHKVINKLK